MRTKKVGLIVGLLLLTATQATAQKISAGYDRAADFSKFQTYSWTKGVPAKHPEVDRQIIASVDRQLQSRGLKRVQDAGQMVVSYHAAVINSFDGATVATPGTWGPRAGSMDQVWQVVRGSLIIEIVDGTTKNELWRVNALDTLSNEATFDVSKDLDKATRKVNKVVEKMFKYYPSTKAKP
jgi:hypothetical protein